MNMRCNPSEVVVGMQSVHSNGAEDRRWRVFCGLVIANEQRSDIAFPQVLTRGRSFGDGTETVDCRPGQVESADIVMARSGDNSRRDCENFCRRTPDCYAFDFARTPRSDAACRLVARDIPRIGDPGSAPREYCTLGVWDILQSFRPIHGNGCRVGQVE